MRDLLELNFFSAVQKLQLSRSVVRTILAVLTTLSIGYFLHSDWNKIVVFQTLIISRPLYVFLLPWIVFELSNQYSNKLREFSSTVQRRWERKTYYFLEFFSILDFNRFRPQLIRLAFKKNIPTRYEEREPLPCTIVEIAKCSQVVNSIDIHFCYSFKGSEHD